MEALCFVYPTCVEVLRGTAGTIQVADAQKLPVSYGYPEKSQREAGKETSLKAIGR